MNPAYMNVTKTAKYFGLGRTKTSAIVGEMEQHPAFRRYIKHVGPTLKLVNINGFERFLDEERR